MIEKWEVLPYPSDRDPNRYRISLRADGQDVAKVRSAFPGRVGAIWVPRRKPYNCAFFLYSISPQEKNDLENMLSGKSPLDLPAPALPVKPLRKNLSKEDTQEILLEVQKEAGGQRTVRLGYFFPNYLPDAADKVQQILSNTLVDKKISVKLEKTFAFSYASLTLKEIRTLIQKCHEEAVNCVVAVGEPARMVGLRKMGKESGVFIRPLPESVLDRNLWLSMIAEIISHE